MTVVACVFSAACCPRDYVLSVAMYSMMRISAWGGMCSRSFLDPRPVPALGQSLHSTSRSKSTLDPKLSAQAQGFYREHPFTPPSSSYSTLKVSLSKAPRSALSNPTRQL
ncbi:hypothetical protein AB1N83_011060 [Pleurotus pulmonarius]